MKMFLLSVFRSIFRPVIYKFSSDELNDRERNTKKEFVISDECKVIGKSFLIRIAERMDTLSQKGKTPQEREHLIARIEELKDILSEWDNLRQDIEVTPPHEYIAEN